MDGSERALIQRVEQLRDKQIKLTQEIIRIPTVNPYSGDDSAASEAVGQDWIQARMADLGAQVCRISVPPDVYERGGMIGLADRDWTNRENVVAEWRFGDGTGRAVVINNHMDTVGASGMQYDPFDPVIRDGRMYGRGSSDTKGNMVMGLTAVEALLKCAGELNGRILFESVVDEECNGGGAGTLACCLAGVTGDFVLCLDGASEHLTNGCNGIGTARVVVRGQAGHSSAGESVNAIDKGFQVKQAIDAFGQEHAREYPACMVNVGVFHSGTMPSTVPGEAELQINMTYAVEDAAAAVAESGHWDGRVFRRRFEQSMSTLSAQDEWFATKPVEVSWIKDMYPYKSDPGHDLIQLAARAAAEIEGREMEIAPMSAWFDGAHLARHLGVPVLSMGRGTPGTAHTDNEYVVVDGLLRGARAMALALHRLLAV